MAMRPNGNLIAMSPMLTLKSLVSGLSTLVLSTVGSSATLSLRSPLVGIVLKVFGHAKVGK